MARRRMRDRVLAGIGQGLQDTSGLLMRTLLQDRQQKRIDDRALAGQQAILSRQSDMADMQALNSLITKAAETGDVDPSAIRELARLQGRNVPDNAFENINPLPRRIDNSLGKTLMDADTPEKVPSNEDIFGVARRRGGGDMPDPALWDALSPVPADSVKGGIDYTQSLNPDVKQFADRAGARRRALMDKPELVDFEDPQTGAKGKKAISLYDTTLKNGGISLGPTAAQAGTLAGDKKTAEINASGQALAGQAGLEAGAVEDAKNTPGRVTARVNEAGRRAGASKVAEINAQLANASKLIDFETQKAMASMQTVATEKEYGEWGKQIADAKVAASTAMPVIGQLRALWSDAQPELERQLKANPDWLVQLRQGYVPRSMQPESVRKYLDLLESARPRLARAMGNVGNFTEQEQARAGFIAPDSIDAANGGRTAEDKFTRLEKLFMAAPSIALRQKPGSKPITAEEMNAIVNSWKPAQSGDINLTAPPVDILITPNGIRRPGGG